MIQLTEIAKFKGFPEKLRLICGSSHCSDHAVLTHNKEKFKYANQFPVAMPSGIVQAKSYVAQNVATQIEMLWDDLRAVHAQLVSRGYHRWTDPETSIPAVKAGLEALADPELAATNGVSITIPCIAIYSNVPRRGYGDKRVFVGVELVGGPALIGHPAPDSSRAYALTAQPYRTFPSELLDRLGTVMQPPYIRMRVEAATGQAPLNDFVNALGLM